MEKYLKLSDAIEELDRLVRTKQIEIIHGDFENIEKHFEDMSASLIRNQNSITLKNDCVILGRQKYTDIIMGDDKNNPLDLLVMPKIAEAQVRKIINGLKDWALFVELDKQLQDDIIDEISISILTTEELSNFSE